MATDRDRVLQQAQRYVEKRRYDKAIEEYRSLLRSTPDDARLQLKVGDLQAKLGQFDDAITTYNRVAKLYVDKGFSLKAVAVYKQVRELIRRQAPELLEKHLYVIPALAEIYAGLNLTGDALAAYDELASYYLQKNLELDAIEVFRRMVELGPENPAPHLRLAETACRIQRLDTAIDSFWQAAEILLRMQRPDDALKVVERILHFRPDPRFARVSAEILLQRNSREDAMGAITRLQMCFQANPRDLDVLGLLARAFQIIGEDAKSVEVYKEMARISRENNNRSLFDQLMGHLLQVAPHDEGVQALRSFVPSAPSLPPPPPRSAAGQPSPVAPPAPPSSAADEDDDELEVELLEDDDLLEVAAEEEAEDTAVDLAVPPPPHLPREATRQEESNVFAAGRQEAPELVVLDEEFEGAEEYTDLAPGSFDPQAHTGRALAEADAFLAAGQPLRAIEPLSIAVELNPLDINLRHRLKEALFQSGDAEGAVNEAVGIAAMHWERAELAQAETILLWADQLWPGHTIVLQWLAEVQRSVREAQGPEFAEPATLERRSAPASLSEVDDPFDAAPLPSEPLHSEPLHSEPLHSEPLHSEPRRTSPSASAGPVDLTEVLEEAEFFASQGLYEDARAILEDQLKEHPGHPLLLEQLQAVEEQERGELPSEATRAQVPTIVDSDDRTFDIAASLDALDSLESLAPVPVAAAAASDDVDVEHVFAKFKEGIRAQVAETDSATHYDLGVAYREMGLLPDAIHEFEVASRDPDRECTCHAMIGQIHVQLGQHRLAIAAFERGLVAPRRTVDQELNLRYELGHVRELLGDYSASLELFEAVASKKPNYRDVAKRVAALKTKISESSRTTTRIEEEDEFDKVFDDLFR